jgi:hypothetical protein
MLKRLTSLHLLVDKQASHALAGTDTHAGKQDLLLRSPRLAQYRANLSGTCSSKRVAKGNSATSGVDFLRIQTQYVHAINSHGGEGLVDFDNVDVVFRKAEFAQELRDCSGRANAHNAGWHTSNSSTTELGKDRLADLNGLGALHQKDRSSWN